MSSQPNRTLRIEVTVTTSQPELLEGLDAWLRLGLISDDKVRQLCQRYLVSPLPLPAEVTAESVSPAITAANPIEVEQPPVKTPKKPLFTQMWESLIDELSVRWLLFLGVFLVVVSSGVLAATQWQNFPAAGQYGVLWGYTIIFWIGSLWAGKQRNLQLTAHTLQLVSLLLIPVNFWAMDSFGLVLPPSWEWLVVGVAALTLTAITIIHPTMRNDLSRLASRGFLLLWLSYLHWGWQWSEFPLVAVYLGMIAAAVLLPRYSRIAQTSDSSTNPLIDSRTGSLIVIYALAVLLGRGIFVQGLPITQLGLAIGVCGWLLARLGQLPQRAGKWRSGGAEGAGGAGELGRIRRDDSAYVSSIAPGLRPSFQSQVWEAVGGILLLIGWLVAVEESFPWQATVVSALGLWFFGNRLQRFWLQRDLLGMFLVGLQAHWLLWRLLPLEFQQGVVAVLTQVTNSANYPFALLSFALFPYLIGMVALTDRINATHQAKLARFSERLTFGFGFVLTFISLANPTLRSLNLFLSTITLATVTRYWTPTRTGLVYLTHITGLLTLASVIDWRLPNLTQPVWAGILLAVMVGEWGFTVVRRQKAGGRRQKAEPTPNPSKEGNRRQKALLRELQIWQSSAWYLGLALSGLSYVLLWNETYTYGDLQILETNAWHYWGLLWLLTPLTLTWVASCSVQPRRKLVAGLSMFALGMVQLLTIFLPGVRLVSLGVATALMLFNTRYCRRQLVAGITVGFALSFLGMSFWEGIPGLLQLSVADWFLVGAIAILSLWLLRTYFKQLPGTLAALYAQAVDGWAVGLCCWQLLVLTFHFLGGYLEVFSTNWEYFLASLLTGSAIIYRYWPRLNNLTVYGIAWAVEISLAEGMLLAAGSTLDLAVANIILALLTLLLTDWLLAKQSPLAQLTSLAQLPLLYALLGISFRLSHFTAYTGFLTLSAGLTGVIIGSRRTYWKGISYLAIAGISLAWYELVIYQMLQTPGENPADGLIILAVVALAIALAYRSLAWFWHFRSHESFLNLSIREIKITAHIHWAVGSLLIVLSVPEALVTIPSLAPVAIATSLVLASYALLQGRLDEQGGRERENTAELHLWVYLGLIELAGTFAYARLLWTELAVLDEWRVVIACVVAYGIYQLPWRSWGWLESPWKLSALVLPLVTVLFNLLLTLEPLSDLSLLVVAGFYGWIALRHANIRFTYISVVLIDWLLWRWFDNLQLSDPLWYVSVLGLSLLYIAQFDQYLQQSQQRKLRHYLRILGSGAICFIAFISHQETGIIPGVISTITIFAGLILRVRAFLFVGTITFLLTTFYQLVVLIFRYPRTKWIVGMIVGIFFIGMALNFETRRSQISSLLRHTSDQLASWE